MKLVDATDELVADALVQRLFDPERNDYSYTLLPITRTFMSAQIARQPGLEASIRRRMADWFEARDVDDFDERLVVREIRQGKAGPEAALLDLAQAAQRRNDLVAAQDLFQQALVRNPSSWKAARLAAGFYWDKLRNRTEALRLYEQAATNAPSRGQDRARIYRDWGLLIKDSGDPEATDSAIEKFEIALLETPNDAVAVVALATMLDRKGVYRRVIELLEALIDHSSARTRSLSIPLLLRAYDRMGETVKAIQLRQHQERPE